MDRSEKTVFVYENWRGEKPFLIGRLYISFIRGQESFSFEYADEWLNSFESAYSLDPDIFLYRGRQYAPQGKSLFGLFADSCPDRWGRLLMTRREAIDARKESRKPRRLTESDFLLGVYDVSRMGAVEYMRPAFSLRHKAL
jgi:serine/threonine-protein kinase HipA